MAWRLLLILAACSGDDPATPDACSDGSLTWSTAGQPFVTTWCTTCHAPALIGPSRFGAPEGLDFNTLDAVREHADRIAERTLTDDATMPPAGPAPADDRDRFGAWLACDAPGTSTPGPVPCDGERHAGDWTASEDGAPCPQINHIDGTLRVDATANGDGWDCLCEAGHLMVEDGAELVVLPALATVGSIDAIGALTLTTLHLPIVERTGTVRLEHLYELTTLGLHRLAVTQSLALDRLDRLEDLSSLDALESSDGGVSISHTPGSDAPLLRRLETVEGDLVIRGLDGMSSLDGFDALDLVRGDLAIEDNELLTAIPGFPGPTVIGGDLDLSSNPMLSTAEAQALADRLEVSGSVVLP